MRVSTGAWALLLLFSCDAVVGLTAPGCHPAGRVTPRRAAPPAAASMPCHGVASEEPGEGHALRAAQRDCCSGRRPCGIASPTPVPLPQIDHAHRLLDAEAMMELAERSQPLLLSRPLDHVPLA